MGPAGKNSANATKIQPKHHLKATANLSIFMIAVSNSPFVTTALKNCCFCGFLFVTRQQMMRKTHMKSDAPTDFNRITSEGDLDQA